MKKSTKGTIAAAAAAVLLMGGGTTIAYWTDQATVEGGSITHGSLALEPVACDETWFHADGGTIGTDPVDLVVPGDEIGKTCTFTVSATGDHLEAALTAPDTLVWDDATTATTFDATVSATYDVGGTEVADGGTITSANDGQTLTATFLVDISYGDEGATDTPVDDDGVNDNDTQNLVSTLDELTLKLTQVDH